MPKTLPSGARRLMRLVWGEAGFASPAVVERAECAFYNTYLRPGMTVFDVGANIGDMTLQFIRLVRSGEVHAFEASAATFERLSVRCRIERETNIFLNNVAVSDREGVASLHVYDDKYSSWNSLARRPLQNYGIDVMPVRTEAAKTTTVDMYCDHHTVRRIDLLKVDVEGAELQVLHGAQQMFQRGQIGCCIFEFGQTTYDMGNNPDDIAAFAADVGYGLRNLIANDPVFPGRGHAGGAHYSMHVMTRKR